VPLRKFKISPALASGNAVAENFRLSSRIDLTFDQFADLLQKIISNIQPQKIRRFVDFRAACSADFSGKSRAQTWRIRPPAGFFHPAESVGLGRWIFA
jgi:hypothetical protein